MKKYIYLTNLLQKKKFLDLYLPSIFYKHTNQYNYFLE